MDEVVALSLNDAAKRFGIGRSKLYRLIGDGEIEARKVGKKTLIMAESLRRFVENAPRATTVQRSHPAT